MKKIGIVLFGLPCSRKTTACQYLSFKYNATSIHMRRIFEELVGVSNAPLKYHELLSQSGGSRTFWLEYITHELDFNRYDNDGIILIEGLFTSDELEWCQNHFGRKLYSVFFDVPPIKDRLDWFRSREGINGDGGAELSRRDSGRIEAGVLNLRNNSDFIINNNCGIDKFYSQLDILLNQINER